jgi:hypothetical protein
MVPDTLFGRHHLRLLGKAQGVLVALTWVKGTCATTLKHLRSFSRVRAGSGVQVVRHLLKE